MAQINGYKVRMPDGAIDVIPHGPVTEVVVGALSMTITTAESRTSVSVSFDLDDEDVEIPIVSIGKALCEQPLDVTEGMRELTAAGTSRVCIVCNGRRICVSNGCIDTPCGTICSP